MIIKQLNTETLSKLKIGEKICLISPFELSYNKLRFASILIIESHNLIKRIDDFSWQHKEIIYNLDDINNRTQLKKFIDEKIQLHPYYIKLGINESYKELIRFFENYYVINYIKYIYGDLSIFTLKSIESYILPESFVELIVNEKIDYCRYYFNNDLNQKRTKKLMWWTIVIAILSLLSNIISCLKCI